VIGFLTVDWAMGAFLAGGTAVLLGAVPGTAFLVPMAWETMMVWCGVVVLGLCLLNDGANQSGDSLRSKL
jgi:hypothetical protein